MRALFITFAFVVALLGGAGSTPGAAARPDNTGPQCTDIKDLGGTYYKVVPDPGPTGAAGFHFEFTIATAPCSNVTYYIYITDSNGGSITASYPATTGNDVLTFCDPATNKFCYDHSFGSTPGGAPTTILVSGASMLGGHTADTAPILEYVLCDTNSADTTYPDCGSGGNSWDQ
jgi:hypothetical protein